mgnify:CR=1 FL=1
MGPAVALERAGSVARDVRWRVALDVAQLETAKARAGEKFTLDAVGSVGGTRASGNTLSGFGGTTQVATSVPPMTR